jgi:predicted metal-dependent peptidase
MNTHERIKDLIAHFVLRFNYWGYLFSRIRRKPVPGFKSIMGVVAERDGTISLYYNPQLVDTTDDKNIEHVLEHEGMHLLNNHLARLIRLLSLHSNPIIKKNRMELWNYASDCSVNSQAKLPDKLIIGGKDWELCHPEKYGLKPGHITEHYYNEIMKNATKVQLPKFCGGGEGDGQACPHCGGTGEEPKEGQSPQECPTCGGSGKDEKGEPCPDCGGTGMKPAEGSGEPCKECGGTGKEGQGGGLDDHSHWGNPDPSADPDTMARKLETHVSGIVRESVRSFQRTRGHIPSHLKELIDNILAPPQVPYYQLIQKYVRGTRFSKFKRSHTTVSRKRTYLFAISDDNLPDISPFPGRKRDFSFKVGILVDTSGSQGKEDIQEALRGAAHVIERDRHTQTTIIEIDTDIKKEYKIKKVRDIQPDVKGRGGTTLGPGLKRFRELGVDVCLAFTDGATENINEISRKYLPKKIIWVIGAKSGVTNNIDRTGPIVKVPDL